MPDTVQLDDEQMENISTRFSDQSEQVRAQMDKIKDQLSVLEQGAWIGPNFDTFKQIMENTLLPAIERLHKSLDKAGDTTKEVAKMIRDADEETKSLFPT